MQDDQYTQPRKWTKESAFTENHGQYLGLTIERVE